MDVRYLVSAGMVINALGDKRGDPSKRPGFICDVWEVPGDPGGEETPDGTGGIADELATMITGASSD